MLHYSLSTVLMAVIATNLLIILLTFCFRNLRVMINAGYKLLALFILFTVLRILLPFELPFSISIYWPDSISLIVWQVHYWLFNIANHPISPWMIFEFIWIVGIFINLLRYGISYTKAKFYITLHAKIITTKEPFAELITKVCQEHNKPNRFTLIELPGLETPVLWGIIKPYILIPEGMNLSDDNWYYVLQHEASHHFHHDILMKNIIRFITIVYWWNPFCIFLNRQTDEILEMRVDDSVTLRDIDATSDYMRCLIAVSEHVNQLKTLPKIFTMSLFPAKVSDMNKRFRMLHSNQEKKKLSLNLLLFGVAATIYLASYIFIVEAFSNPDDTDISPNPTYQRMIIPAQVDSSATPSGNETFDIQAGGETYAIQRPDGTYDTYYNGEYLETTDSLEYYLGITVYTEEDCPY